jgi:protocatechuate 3,4-dioxygenase beta subunit
MSSLKKEKIQRREFISNAVRIAVCISLPVNVSCKDGHVISPVKEECITTADILGPFYKTGAPFVENIIPPENTAPQLIIRGKVYSNCDMLVKDAVIEIWNADSEGVYDNVTFKFRGQHKTGETGTYSFITIVPGRYLNGSSYRPSHIHFRITAPDHQDLVSQIYFKDDPFIATDPWAGDPKAAERILVIGKDENGTDSLTFDIHLT